MNQNTNILPTVAIVGRPNVGKSSLFNAIIGRRLSIVHEQSGVTRDRLVAQSSHKGRHFQLIDTGGLGMLNGENKNVDRWDSAIRNQAEAAIEGADVLVMVVNVQEGVVPLDLEVAVKLRESGQKIILAVNKSDNSYFDEQCVEFASLGIEAIYPVSSLHRRGIEPLLDAASSGFPKNSSVQNNDETQKPFGIAVVGRPNVGKSSLVNCLLGEQRVMVSDVAGTTRDSIDIDFQLRYKDENLAATLIDTAGMRKRAKVRDALEMFSVMRAKSAIERADLVLLMVEANMQGLTAQDKRVASLVAEANKACIIVANKYDISAEKFKVKLLDEIRYTLPQMTYAPVVFTSATEDYNIDFLLDTVAEVMGQMEIKVPTAVLNRVISEAFERNSPPVTGLAPFKIYYSTMLGNSPPSFLLFVNNPKYCAANYLGYLNNCLRQAFDFTGLPIVIRLKERPKKVESIRTVKSPAKKSGKSRQTKRPASPKKTRVKPNYKKRRKER